MPDDSFVVTVVTADGTDHPACIVLPEVTKVIERPDGVLHVFTLKGEQVAAFNDGCWAYWTRGNLGVRGPAPAGWQSSRTGADRGTPSGPAGTADRAPGA